MPNNEKQIFTKVLSLSKNQIQSAFTLKTQNISNGKLFLSFDIVLDNDTGFITCTYNFNDKLFNSIDMDLNFRRPAGYNNYSELKDVILHILNNI